jgi:hypothetical protein
MPITAPNFSATESLGMPEQVTLTDTSTGSDAGLTERRVYFRMANGKWLTTAGESTTPAYEVWPIADSSITLSLLSQSTTLEITVFWMTAEAVTYQKSTLYCFDLFDYLFAYNLIGAQTSDPGIIQDTSYYSNFSAFIVNMFCAESAVIYGDDLYSSQAALNRNQVLIDNEGDYF